MDEPLHCLVEIPKGSRNKYEWDDALGGIKLDRFLFSSVVYPDRLRLRHRHAGRGRRPARRDGLRLRADVLGLPDPGHGDRGLPHDRRQGPGRQDPLRAARGPELERAARARRPARPAAHRDRALLLDLQAARGQGGRRRRLVRARGRAARSSRRAARAGGRSAPDARRRAARRCGGVRAPRRVVRRRSRDGAVAGPDPELPVFARSAVKPLQALGSVRAGVLERFGLGDAPPRARVRVARRLGRARGGRRPRCWTRAGCVEDALGCGPELPLDPRAAAGVRPSRIRHNCSGKHAFGLARCLAEGWPLDGYFRAGHRLQRAMRDCVVEACGVTAPTRGGDRRLRDAHVRRAARRAGARVRAARGRRARRVRATAAPPRCARIRSSSPTTGAIDTELMRAEDGLVAKIGAEGVLAVGLAGRPRARAEGARRRPCARSRPPASRSRAPSSGLAAAVPDALAAAPIVNSRGVRVGELRADSGSVTGHGRCGARPDDRLAKPCSSAPLTLASSALRRYSASASGEPKRRPGAASGPWWQSTQCSSASRRSGASAASRGSSSCWPSTTWPSRRPSSDRPISAP